VGDDRSHARRAKRGRRRAVASRRAPCGHARERRERLARDPVRPRVTWPRDDAKLERVRALMVERELDALVVRAPDNVLYLTDYWCMKGYDLAVFPREGEPALVVLEPQAEEADRSWAGELRLFGGYDAADPRPPTARAVEATQAVVRERGYGRIGLE